MKKPYRLKHLVPAALALAVLAGMAARAGGPLMVGGPGMAEGLPFIWTVNPLTYWTDLGYLGTHDKAWADDLVAQAFTTWQNVPTANIGFNKAGDLSQDVTVDNIWTVLDEIQACSEPLTGIAKERTVVYDVDGSIVAELGMDNNSVLGFAQVVCAGSDGTTNYFLRALVVLNGRFLDGIDTYDNGEITPEGFKAVMIHEFGHMIGLDHAQINLNCLMSYCAPGSDALNGVPTMFPILISEEGMATLAVDDIAAVSELYPETVDNAPTQVPFLSTTGRITGQVFFSDGSTPAQGFNVIARSTTAPLVSAISGVSGFLYTVDAGNPVYGWDGSPFGSRDPTLIGFYSLPGLPPGDYTVEVEAIFGDFVGGSSVGPIGNYGFQFPLPSLLPTPPPCTPEYYVSGATATCTSGSATTVPVTAGSTVPGADVILIATPPRYDAWEGGSP